MKIVKLNNRHNAFKKGYTCALRFEEWNTKVHFLENKVTGLFGRASYSMTNSECWYAQLSKNNDPVTKVRPYWIYFRKESDITFLQLATNI